jgi:hypothetical protein
VADVEQLRALSEFVEAEGHLPPLFVAFSLDTVLAPP